MGFSPFQYHEWDSVEACVFATRRSVPQYAQFVQSVWTARWQDGQAARISTPQRGQKTKSSCTGALQFGHGRVAAWT